LYKVPTFLKTASQSNWIFYGTNLVHREGGKETTIPLASLFKNENRGKLEEIKRYIKVWKIFIQRFDTRIFTQKWLTYFLFGFCVTFFEAIYILFYMKNFQTWFVFLFLDNCSVGLYKVLVTWVGELYSVYNTQSR